MLTTFTAIVCLILLSSVKYVIFGIGEFNDIIFHYTQFITFNNYLKSHIHSGVIFSFISNIALLSFFGLSPHDNMDQSFDLLYGTLSDDDNDHDNNNGTRRELRNHVDKVTSWIDDNKFLLSLIILFSITVIAIIITWMYSLYKQGLFNDMYQKYIVEGRSRRPSDDFITEDQLVEQNPISKKSDGYYNVLIGIALICYCQISTITIAQLLEITDSSVAIGFLSIATMLVFVIGFPIYIAKLLYEKSSVLYDTDMVKKYGVLYMHFKKRNSRFMIIILIKQLIYSVIINISPHLTILQNTFLVLINILFLVGLLKYSPYADGLYYIQAVIMSISTVIISLLNYIFIANGKGDNTSIFVFTLISMIVHIGTFLCFAIIQGIKYIYQNNKTKIKEVKDDLYSGHIVTDGDVLEQRFVVNKFRTEIQMSNRDESKESEEC